MKSKSIAEGYNYDEEVVNKNSWCYRYDVKVNNVIKDANEYFLRKKTLVPLISFPVSAGAELKKQ